MIDWPDVAAAHEAKLWQTAYRIVNHYDDALDCCQEALLDAYDYSRTHAIEDWRALLTSLVTRRAIDRLRQRYRLRHNLVALDSATEQATNAACPVRAAEAAELLERFRLALTELPEKQAAVLWLSCVEQFTHEEISRQLMISQNESHVLLHRARSRLATLLDRDSAAHSERSR